MNKLLAAILALTLFGCSTTQKSVTAPKGGANPYDLTGDDPPPGEGGQLFASVWLGAPHSGTTTVAGATEVLATTDIPVNITHNEDLKLGCRFSVRFTGTAHLVNIVHTAFNTSAQQILFATPIAGGITVIDAVILPAQNATGTWLTLQCDGVGSVTLCQGDIGDGVASPTLRNSAGGPIDTQYNIPPETYAIPYYASPQ